MENFMIMENEVIFKDFGKRTTDTENRDEKLKSYICAVLDIDDFDFDNIKSDFKSIKEKEHLIKIICNDVVTRSNRLFRER